LWQRPKYHRRLVVEHQRRRRLRFNGKHKIAAKRGHCRSVAELFRREELTQCGNLVLQRSIGSQKFIEYEIFGVAGLDSLDHDGEKGTSIK
jgi:hypothetical protein